MTGGYPREQKAFVTVYPKDAAMEKRRWERLIYKYREEESRDDTVSFPNDVTEYLSNLRRDGTTMHSILLANQS